MVKKKIEESERGNQYAVRNDDYNLRSIVYFHFVIPLYPFDEEKTKLSELETENDIARNRKIICR